VKFFRVAIVFVILFIFLGCVRVNVEQREGGKVIDRTSYYPLSKMKDIKRWNGITALHLAAIEGNTGRIKELLKRGSNPFAKTVHPVNGSKWMPIELAWVVKQKVSVRILAEYMLKHYKSYLKRNEKTLISTLSSLWEVDPLLAFELSAKYGYDKWAYHILKKLFNTKEYSGTKGKISLARTLVHRKYTYSLHYLAKICPSCVRMAYDREVANLTDVFDTRRIVGERIRQLKYYRPYVSALDYKKAQILQKRYNEAIRLENKQFYDTISNAFHRSASNTSNANVPVGNSEFDVVLKCRSYYDIKHITIRKDADEYGSGLKSWADQNGEQLCRRYAPSGYTQYDGVYNIKKL